MVNLPPCRPARGTCSCPVAWSTRTAWRCEKVPLRVSCPVTRTLTPSSSSEPKAKASPNAQSISPSATTLSRCSNCRASLGWRTNPSGTERTSVARRLSTDESTPVSTGGIHRSGTTYSGSTGVTPAADSASALVSSSAACNRAPKSSSACSATSSEMSPLRTSVSV